MLYRYFVDFRHGVSVFCLVFCLFVCFLRYCGFRYTPMSPSSTGSKRPLYDQLVQSGISVFSLVFCLFVFYDIAVFGTPQCPPLQLIHLRETNTRREQHYWTKIGRHPPYVGLYFPFFGKLLIVCEWPFNRGEIKGITLVGTAKRCPRRLKCTWPPYIDV